MIQMGVREHEIPDEGFQGPCLPGTIILQSFDVRQDIAAQVGRTGIVQHHITLAELRRSEIGNVLMLDEILDLFGGETTDLDAVLQGKVHGDEARVVVVEVSLSTGRGVK